MEASRRKKLMKTIFRITSLAALAVGVFVLSAPIFGQKAAARSTEEAKGLASELSALEKLEKALPADRMPGAGMSEADRARTADAFYAAGVKCHDIQRDFAQSMIDKADEYFRASLAYRDSALARAHLGSAHIIQARDAASVISKVAEANTGLKEVDAAVKSAPDDILVRAIRIECTIELPEMFKRLDTVTADLKNLLERYAKSPSSFDGMFPPSRLFELKAKELELRGKGSMAAQYRDKAKALAEAAATAAAAKKE